MNCTKCGKEIPDGENKLCDECKNSLLSDIGNEEDNKFEIKKDQKVKKEKEPKKKGKTGIIVGIILAIAIVAIVVLELTTGMFSQLIFKENKVGITIGNNNNNIGFANKQGNWIYYMSLSDDGMQIAINKVRTDGTEKQKLIEKDWEVSSINVYGDYIYFVALEPAQEGETIENSSVSSYPHNRIYKMSTDGKEVTILNDGNFSSNLISIYVVKDRIYYVGANYNIYSMDLFGGDRTKINDNQTGFIGVTDKYILYNDYPEDAEAQGNFVTYVMNLDGSNPRPINGKALYNPNVVGDVVYYVNSENNAVHRVNIDGSNDEKVYDSKAYNMNVYGDYIYYLNFKDESAESTDDTACIHRVRIDGKDHEIVMEMENSTSFINIVGDWIYYTDHSDNALYINLVKTDGSDTLNLYTYDFNGTSSSEQ